MTTSFTYQRGAELPGLTLPWQEETAQNTWTDLDLSSGYTFTLTLTNITGAVVVTKTTGITGANGSVVVAWAANELDIAADAYTLRLRAREVATSKDRDYRPAEPLRLRILP